MKIAILWYWKEWQSTYKYLLKNGFSDITILDQKDNPNYLENLEKFDIIYKSPWISIYKNELQKVRNNIKTQADIFFENYKWKIILVTWSKWKSTTSTIIYKTLQNAWKNVKIVWNIWNPILSEIDFENQPDYVVFEISSYMLDTSKPYCDYAILTNIYTVHTSWHQTHENYINAKLKVFNNCKNCILRSDYNYLLEKINCENIILFWENTTYYFDEKYIYSKKYKLSIENIKLLWKHNFLNIASILYIFEDLNIKQKIIEKTLSEFSWLEHRQEYVWEYNWIHFYNDSIATIPESVLQALDRFQDNIDTIILWWRDDNFDYIKLIEKINDLSISNIIFLPDSFNKQKQLFKNKNIFEVYNIQDAVKIAKKYTKYWKICILSPWATSYNLFKNFEERWELFKKYIKND